MAGNTRFLIQAIYKLLLPRRIFVRWPAKPLLCINIPGYQGHSLTNQYKILDSNYTDEILSFSTGNQSGARLFNSYFMINNYFIHTDKIKNQ